MKVMLSFQTKRNISARKKTKAKMMILASMEMVENHSRSDMEIKNVSSVIDVVNLDT
jgi:hypothetical protein